jgi:hypothetical protein
MSKIEVNAIEPQCGTNLTVGASGDTITFPSGTTVVNNGSQTGFGRTGTVDWDTTAKTASFTAVSGNGYFVNTTSGAVTMTLPATPSAGDIVSVKDYAYTFATNNLTVNRNGSPIGGGSGVDTIDYSTNGDFLTFIYVDGTKGWVLTNDSTNTDSLVRNFITATGGTITTCGNCKIHTFTSPGTFCVSQISTTAPENIVSYLVVAGGGGGGSGNGGGGGGGSGGFREYKSPITPYTASPLDGNPGGTAVTITQTSYPITIGSGGTGAGGSAPDPEAGTNGSNSIFSTVTSAGGGAGGASPTTLPSFRNGLPGGSGGGASGSSTATGGTGNTPPVSPAQGFNGGNSASPPCSGGGGGGATSIGTNGTGPAGGDGGNGAGTGINPSPSVGTPGPSAPLRYFSGGGGANHEGGTNPGSGGYGGGADGVNPGSGGNNGTTNTGGGGGGIDNVPSVTPTHNGGSGIVIIRYKYQ